jgi:hypothetical protein
MGQDEKATFDPPRSECSLDDVNPGKEDGFKVYDFQIDLPYDHSYLVENLIDPAHVFISHDRTEGGMNREDATPYDMQLDEDSFSTQGFTGRMRSAASATMGGPFINVTMEAPGIVRYHSTFGNIVFGTALHCMPLSLGKSRLLFRTMSKGMPQKRVDRKPKWLRHLNSCKVLEQDVGLITTQEDHFARNPERTLADEFILLSSSDKFVGAYRRWLDRVGHGMPWFQGLVSSSSNVYSNTFRPTRLPPGLDPAGHAASGQDIVETRYHRHVMHCPATRNALRNVTRLKRAFIAATALAVTAALGVVPVVVSSGGVSSGSMSACRTILPYLVLPLVPLCATGAAAAHQLQQRFYVSFKRKDQLRTEKGV